MTGLNYTRRKIVKMLKNVHGGMVSKELIEWECWTRKGKTPPHNLVAQMAQLRWDYGIPIECCRSRKGKGRTEGWRIPFGSDVLLRETLRRLPPSEVRMLDILKSANGEWVSVENIYRTWNCNGDHRSGEISKPLSRLRRYPGVVIEAKPLLVSTRGRPCVVAYRLVPQAERLAA